MKKTILLSFLFAAIISSTFAQKVADYTTTYVGGIQMATPNNLNIPKASFNPSMV
jgi:uncharacterized membrane protein required for colicin V production